MDAATIAKLIGLAANLLPEVALVREMATVVQSGDPAQMDAMLARLQAENDELGAA